MLEELNLDLDKPKGFRQRSSILMEQARPESSDENEGNVDVNQIQFENKPNSDDE